MNGSKNIWGERKSYEKRTFYGSQLCFTPSSRPVLVANSEWVGEVLLSLSLNVSEEELLAQKLPKAPHYIISFPLHIETVAVCAKYTCDTSSQHRNIIITTYYYSFQKSFSILRKIDEAIRSSLNLGAQRISIIRYRELHVGFSLLNVCNNNGLY